MPKITPYKQGRTERLQVRLKPETKARLERLAIKKETMADVITRLIDKEFEATIAYVDKLTDYGRNDTTE